MPDETHSLTRRIRTAAGLVLLLSSAWFLKGCTLSTPPERSEVLARALPATTTIPEGWQQAGSVSDGIGDNWLASFDDPQLDQIVAEALANNLDLRQSASTLLVVAQSINLAKSQMLPHVGATAGEHWTRNFDRNYTNELNDVNIGLSWELDIWGRLRAQKAAAEANYAAAALDYAYARQSLAATTARSWFAAVQRVQLLALAEQSTVIYDQLLKVSQARQRAGKVSDFDVIQAQAALDAAQAGLQDAMNQLAMARRNLEMLLGRYPAAEIALAANATALPPPAQGMAPLSLLARRPDVLAAEQQVRSAFRSLEADRLALLPDLAFQLNIGRFSDNIGSLLDINPWLGHTSIGMKIPIYEGGALVAQIDIADAQEQAAIAAYGSTVLKAFKEVETDLGNEYYLSSSLVYVDKAVASLGEAVQLANIRYQAGAADMQSTLQLQSRELATKADALDLRYSLLANRVNLYLALGSSFDNEPVIPPQLVSALAP